MTPLHPDNIERLPQLDVMRRTAHEISERYTVLLSLRLTEAEERALKAKRPDRYAWITEAVLTRPRN